MDETRKTLQVDDSKTVAELMFTVCAKLGITNHEEYSLIRPSDEDEKMRTLTLRKGRGSIRNLEKLEKMKQKLHTDDEFNWLAPGKTLRQHGVDESEILLLRRKYFYSDQNVDTRDPVQLNLLYVQLKEAILNGTHPISQDQAINLAALQCQAEYGPMVPEKMKRNPIDLKDRLPKEYIKSKGIEKRILEQYQKLGNYDEKEAKLRYVQLCRSLPTYGITFFLIKEKLKGRNKLVPRLFGVSKESVMRVDEKTKEIIETWPLTRIRRWAATANLFTLDFGQYSPDGNYIMQTTEGEQIAQLISGYVDIILRRQRSRDGGQTEGDEENTIIEENITPSKANVIANMNATLPRGHRAQEANLSHSGLIRTASQRENFAEGHLAVESHTISRHNLSGNNNIGSGLIVNSNGDVTPGGKYGLATDLEQLQKRVMPQVNLSCNIARVQPYDVKNQVNLLAASQNLMKCLEDLLRSADAVAPTIQDSGIQSALTGVTRNTQACLTDLRLCFANSETVLGNEPPELSEKFYHSMNGDKNSPSNGLTESDYHVGNMEANELAKISKMIEQLRIELFDTSYHLLPNETLDSICVSLWSAITDYNQIFNVPDEHQNSNNQLEQPIWHKLPHLIERIQQTCNNHDGTMKKIMQSRLNIVQELLHHLEPILRGIRSLAVFFHNAAQSKSVDSNLARVINVSHGVASKRQSSISVCSNHTNASITNTEQQTQLTANAMHQNLMSIAETCLVTAGQLITWALRNNSQIIPDYELQDASVTADQLNTSINAVLGYIPGEVTIRRLFALLQDASRILEMSTNEQLDVTTTTTNHQQHQQKSNMEQLSTHESPTPLIPLRTSNLPIVDIYEQIGETAKQLARTCLSVSYEISGKMKPSKTESSFGSHSNLILLACIADRLTSALADVVRAAGYRSAQLRSVGHLLNNFNQAAEPVAYGLQHTMRTLESSQNDTGVPSANLTLAKSILKLREWALELDQKAVTCKEQTYDAASSHINNHDSDTDDHSQLTVKNYNNHENENANQSKIIDTFMHMRNQCDVLLHRLDSLIHPNVYNEVNDDKSLETTNRNSTFCPILLPINDLNYPQCCDTVCDIDKEYNEHLNVIPSSIVDNKAGLFIQSIKGLGQVANHLVQITYQAAYLIAAAHPASRPGHVARFRSPDQLNTIHDHVAVIRKSVSEICKTQYDTASNGLPSLEILSTANHLAQRATQLCQTTRPYLSEIKNLSEKRRLADSLEHVARSAAAVFNIIKTSRSTNPTSGTTDLIQKLCSTSSMLEADVDQYIDLLLRDASGSPTHLAEETYELQVPVLKCGQTVAKCIANLIDSSRQLIDNQCQIIQTKLNEEFSNNNNTNTTTTTTNNNDRVGLSNFEDGRHNLHESCLNLLSTLRQNVPGLSICDQIQKIIKNLLNDLNHVIVSGSNVNNQLKQTSKYSSNVHSLESSLALIRTSIEQIEHWSLETIENCQLGHWEIMAHNLHSISTYLPNFVKESIRTCGSLLRLSDQTNLNSLTRTVLEAMQQLIDCVSITLKGRSQSLPVSNCHSSLINYTNQLQQACIELSKQIDTIAIEQGGLNWHIATITSACSKLDDIVPLSNGSEKNNSTENAVSLPTSFVQLHTRLGHQSRELSDLMVRVTEVYAANQGENCTEIISSFVQQFLQMTETVQQMSSVLKMHPQIDTGPALAQKLCHATQAIGAAASEFLRAPLHTDRVNNLTSRFNDLKAVLQSCAHGADACTTAIANLNRLVADLDTAALFARAGTTTQESFKAPISPSDKGSIAFKQRAFQTVQEAVMQAEKGIVEDMQTLIKTTSTDQDALAISAQNCLLRATELTESTKNAASCLASLLSSSSSSSTTTSTSTSSTPDVSIESQVQLFTATRDVIAGLVRLLNHGKAISSACYALEFWNNQTDEKLMNLMKTKQNALNDTAVEVIETISSLSQTLRSISDLFSVPTKSPNIKDDENQSSASSVPPPTVPVKKISLKVSVQKSTNFDKKIIDPAKLNVHHSLESIISVLGNLNERLNKWNVKDGLLHTPDSDSDAEFERQTALGQTINPSYLVCAARAITQAATNANNATGSGKLSEIGLAGDMIRRTAEELVRRLHSVLQTSLTSISASNNQTMLSNGRANAVNESGTGNDNTSDDRDETMRYHDLEKICQRAIHGSANTMSELKQLVEHMNKALDSGPGSPDSVQVTLAMRRLRETVFEIVDCSMSLPGAKEDDIADFKPNVCTKPIPVVIDNKVISSCDNPFDRKSIYNHSMDIEKSIAEANATAIDNIDHSEASSSSFSSTSGVQNALQDLAGEIERSVERIGLLHSKHSFKNSLNSQKPHSQMDQSKDTMAPTSKSSTTVASTTNIPISTNVNNHITNTGSANEDIDLESSDGMDAIIIACRNLVHATLSLMYWAAAAQRELIQQGRLKPIDLQQTPESESEAQWAQGLISAARYVAVGANHLVESAQAFVTMHVVSGSSQSIDSGDITMKPESLISAAQTTAGYTAQLVIACIAKANPNSQSCLGLRNAGGSVKHAADRLVRIVQMVMSKNKSPATATATTTTVDADKEQSDASLDNLSGRVVSSMRQVIETKSSIAAKQRELDKLHAQLKHIHQDQYRSHVQ
ncbi:unnamed protein product [Schistosoma turkestanicum]|nr:unnamed protein product [Schistosoma turkestanicum]